jgi:ABC-type sugar transport system ATPase subunit
VVALLRLNAVFKSFAGVRALRHVPFELRPHEVHALVGESAAGKSTLIRVVTGAVYRTGQSAAAARFSAVRLSR